MATSHLPGSITGPLRDLGALGDEEILGLTKIQLQNQFLTSRDLAVQLLNAPAPPPRQASPAPPEQTTHYQQLQQHCNLLTQEQDEARTSTKASKHDSSSLKPALHRPTLPSPP
ncbi:hypothetical protein HOY80DRAFT_1006427 [Tuber brumale]|nr:hypothetical protein HOY80DRAFT_1006427 [Tuber brumale]